MKTATEKILEIKEQIRINSIMLDGNTKFMGAGIIITDDKDTENYDSAFNVVRTKYAYELSSLIFKLKESLSLWLDHITKYAFYGNIADFANEYISNEGDNQNMIDYVLDKLSDYAKKHFRSLYFAYGSNMDKKQMRNRCKDSSFLGIAKLRGYDFTLDARGFSSIKESTDGTVWGAIWSVSEADIEKLDWYEGVANKCYERVILKVSNAKFNSIKVFAYISLRGIENINKNPEYLDMVINAATECGIDEEYVGRIREFAR